MPATSAETRNLQIAISGLPEWHHAVTSRFPWPPSQTPSTDRSPPVSILENSSRTYPLPLYCLAMTADCLAMTADCLAMTADCLAMTAAQALVLDGRRCGEVVVGP